MLTNVNNFTMKNKKTRLLKESNEYDIPEEVVSFKGTFVVAGTRKGAIDGMPSNLQLRAFRKFENFKQ